MKQPSPPVPAWDVEDPRALIDLICADTDLYRNRVSDIVQNNHLFGGQVYAQAMAAAGETVDGRLIHSAHGYFLRAGDGSRQVEFAIERIRDGRTMSARSVVARQDGREIFRLTSSWQIELPLGAAHGSRMPAVPLPEELETLENLAASNPDPVITVPWERLRQFRAVQVRPCPEGSEDISRGIPTRSYWLRLNGAVRLDEGRHHPPLLAYLSDYWLAGAATGAHHTRVYGRNPNMTSVDHAIWFHEPVDVSDWLLYRVEAPASGYGRTLARGMIYNRHGTLIATSVQEAVMR